MDFDRGGVGKRRGVGPWAALGLVLAVASGCRVNKDDLHRWKGTVNGPDKLVSVLTHDKYEKDLRVEAAWSLVEMKKRGGQAIGLSRLIDELQKLPAAERKEILAGLWQRLAPKMAQPIESAGEGKFTDPSVVYKDATFALYSDDKLDLDPKIREEMTVALNDWAVGKSGEPGDKRLTSFETRMENAAQAYGVEQILRKLGLPAAQQLPSLLAAPTAIKSQRLDSIARIVVDVKPPAGDKAQNEAYEKAREELSANFAAILKSTLGTGYIDAVKGEIEEALKKAPNGKAVLENKAVYDDYMNKARDERATQLFSVAKLVGRKPVVDALLAVAADEKADAKHRALALAALEGNVDTSTDAHLNAFLAIAKSSAPDETKHVALVRITAYPPDKATQAFYKLFEEPNWRVRFDAAMSILQLMEKVGDKAKTTPKEFLSKLPAKDTVAMGLAELYSYGDFLATKLPKEMNAKAAADEAIKGSSLGAQIAGLAWYYAGGTKDDYAFLAKYETDKSSVPKCKEEDECGWERPGCPVPKADKPEETEDKAIATVGDFVQYCVKPAIEKRAKAPKEPPKEGGN